ncbi:3-oxoacyl-ACP reductase [Brucella anthropi]|uniref:SDR family oxidoreductase n=1 Tax=Brucella anthropi TaxID=529 RepID=UPI003987186D
MDLGLKGRKAIVCASSKGLGRACAEALAEAGCDLVLNGRNEEALATAAEAIRKAYGVKVDAVAADISSPEGQADLISACPAPDILVNNNGGPAFKDFRLLDRDAILQGVTQNMVTPIELIKAVIDGMVERRFGRIVNITSTSVYAPIPGLDLSSGARAGLTAFLAGVARTVAASNVTINNILPGAFDTDRLRSGFAFAARKNGTTPETEAEKRASAIPARRIGQPKEFGQACAFLCSEHSGFITGQNLVIDGGAYQSAF